MKKRKWEGKGKWEKKEESLKIKDKKIKVKKSKERNTAFHKSSIVLLQYFKWGEG